eukprot:4200916-Pleurochrysis_carterae.AAC.1
MHGPYSWHRAFRGSTDDLHFAMGFEPGLPVSYGRRVCSPLIAASMRLNFDLPLFSHEELRPNPLLNERVVQWDIGGARGNLLHWSEGSQEEKLALMDITCSSCNNAPAAAISPSCYNAPTAATQAEDDEHLVTEESELCSSNFISPLQVPEWIFDATTEGGEIWSITPKDQMQDALIRFIRESHTASKEDQETWSRQRMRTAQKHALTHVLDLNGFMHRLTKYGPKKLVPPQRRFTLVHACHRLLETERHRRVAAMANRLRQHCYYWEGMLTHCEQMCQHCE